MFLNAVILILQEILEAALVVSVLLALIAALWQTWGRTFELRPGRALMALSIGMAGAWLYAELMPAISEWFDYVGQEITNSLFHLLSLIALLGLAWLPAERLADSVKAKREELSAVFMATIVVLAFVREGSEILIYLLGVTGQTQHSMSVLSGAFVGAGIGLSCGVFLYFSLVSLNRIWTLRMCVLLTALIAGNMASQIVMLLSQADWLPYTGVAWDSSLLVSENSLGGRLLYALVGYEATPSILQALCYLAGMVAILPSPLARLSWRPRLDFHRVQTS